MLAPNTCDRWSTMTSFAWVSKKAQKREALESCFPTPIQFSDQKSVRVNSAANLTLNLQAPRKAGVLCHSFPRAGSGRDWAGRVLRLCSFSVPWELLGSGHQNNSCLALTERWKTQECMCASCSFLCTPHQAGVLHTAQPTCWQDSTGPRSLCPYLAARETKHISL